MSLAGGRPSTHDKIRSESKRWDDKTIERRNIEKLLQRLEDAALGLHWNMVDCVEWIIKAVNEADTDQMSSTEYQMFARLIASKIENIRMSTAEVKAAEVIIDRCLPKLAQVEHNIKGEIAQIVRFPNRVANAEDWRAMVHETHTIPTLTRQAGGVTLEAERGASVPPVQNRTSLESEG